MILKPTPISTSRLTWCPRDREFVTDASLLDHQGLRPSRVYDDACDVGYTLVSHRTGKELVVAHDDTVKNREGEVVAWVYRPVRRSGGLDASISLHVLND